MKVGFLFPGQGSQYVGMGKDLYDAYKEIRNVYDDISKILGADVAKLTFESSNEELMQTKNTQVAILAMSLGILRVLEENEIRAEVAAGLSLGEYTALIYGNVFDFSDGVRLVQKRGEYMQDMLPRGDWGMAAFLGVDEETVNKICNEVKSGFVIPVNFNCPGQIAISGEKCAVLEAIDVSKTFNVKKAVELNTSGPFHTEKLVQASDALREEFDKISIFSPRCTVLKNLDGEIYSDNDDVKEILCRHIISPVRFDKCIDKMLNMGIDTFVEIGPRKNSF